MDGSADVEALAAAVDVTVPEEPALADLVTRAADRAAVRWAAHQGLR